MVCGYSFGDAHINIEIERALQDSDGRLTVVAFTSQNGPSGDLAKWQEDPEICDQLLIFAKGGFFHGQRKEQSEHDLPWWKFETVTSLLEGQR